MEQSLVGPAWQTAWRREGPGRWSRPLGRLEEGFFWDNALGGTADTLRTEICRFERSLDDDTPLEDALRRAWVVCKLRHPLLGATVRSSADEEEGSDATPEFVIDADSLLMCAPKEVTVFRDEKTPTEVEAMIRNWLEEYRVDDGLLDPSLLARLWVVPGPERLFHFVFAVQHLIVDGASWPAIGRDYFRALVDGISPLDVGYSDVELESRLRLLPSCDSLDPGESMPLARRRWRRATAAVVLQNRNLRLQGGHTLPRLPPSPTGSTADSRFHQTVLSPELTARILNGCRQRKVTFTAVLAILQQVAHSAVLHRLRKEGKICSDEWAERLAQPMFSTGPFSLRPYLDPGWRQATQGGMDQVIIAINFLSFRLLPLPRARWALEDPPPRDATTTIGELLPAHRFWHRVGLVAAQLKTLLSHPLFVELGRARLDLRVEIGKLNVSRWRAQRLGTTAASARLASPVKPHRPHPTAGANVVVGNGGSSLGDVSARRPRLFTGRAATLQIESYETRLHCRPGELYQGASTDRDPRTGEPILSIFCFFDASTFEPQLVGDWIAHIILAAESYFDAGSPDARLSRSRRGKL